MSYQRKREEFHLKGGNIKSAFPHQLQFSNQKYEVFKMTVHAKYNLKWFQNYSKAKFRLQVMLQLGMRSSMRGSAMMAGEGHHCIEDYFSIISIFMIISYCYI